ncbi:MAG: hypothetical protein FD134_2254 [Gallionellaceae bacterium]|nr:MAG: hypothetical protein FD134_2254 [Gallionellaceae bacterium]
MNTLTQDLPLTERRKPGSQLQSGGWPMFLLTVGLLLFVGYAASMQKLYKPGDEVGYNLGLVGGAMMLALLLYPLRKRWSFMKGLSILPKWFKLHMVLGILGPTLIMFHAAFSIGSINAGVALVCMLLVAGSGVFGRFFYTKIHHGLYGRHASLKELQTAMVPPGEIQSLFSFAPDIQQSLEHFQTAYATRHPKGGEIGLQNFILAGWNARRLSVSLERQLHLAMYVKAREGKWDDAQMKRLDRMHGEYCRLLRAYLVAVRDVAQFHTYERLFSLWHVFHIPLVYMMVFSAIWHVIAVHMY